jgi:hypothetical protein
VKKYLSWLLYLFIFIFVFWNIGFNETIKFMKGIIQIFIFTISCINKVYVTIYRSSILSELFSHVMTFRLVKICLFFVSSIISSRIVLKYIGKILYKILNNIISTILDNIYKLI